MSTEPDAEHPSRTERNWWDAAEDLSVTVSDHQDGEPVEFELGNETYNDYIVVDVSDVDLLRVEVDR